MEELKKEYATKFRNWRDDGRPEKVWQWIEQKLKQEQKTNKIKIGGYTLCSHSDKDCLLWMTKHNEEGMSFSPELLEKFFNENI